jgi:short-subunit dehydrogenase
MMADRMRETALITGASSGIGTEFARLLAARQFDLVITARRKDRLEDLRTNLSQQHGICVTAIENDLGTAEGAEQLYAAVQLLGRPISMLINNAGFGNYGMVSHQDLNTIRSMIQVNVTSMTMLARLFGSEMGRRGHGYILNVSSFAAIQPIPRYTVYSAAKAYVLAFSQALRYELSRKDVQVSVLVPGFTRTEFHAVAGHEKTMLMRWTSLDATHVAQAGIRGVLKGKAVIIPGFWYKANALASRILPRSAASALAAAMVKR